MLRPAVQLLIWGTECSQRPKENVPLMLFNVEETGSRYTAQSSHIIPYLCNLQKRKARHARGGFNLLFKESLDRREGQTRVSCLPIAQKNRSVRHRFANGAAKALWERVFWYRIAEQKSSHGTAGRDYWNNWSNEAARHVSNTSIDSTAYSIPTEEAMVRCSTSQ